ncbi:hypothetical protein WDU94_006326 [Cyamophila willieti]
MSDSEASNAEYDTTDTAYDNEQGGGDHEGGELEDSHRRFVRILKHYPIILSKSQMPCVKHEKNQAIRSMIEHLERETGIRFNEKQVLKKCNNMKTKVRAKMMMWENSGSKRVKMPKWADDLLDLISGEYTAETRRMTVEDFTNDSQNYIPASESGSVYSEDIKPAVAHTSSTTCVSGVGVPSSSNQHQVNATSSNSHDNVRITRASSSHNSNSLLVKSALEAHETDETRDMSNADLQRLVYLEQLKLARIQMKYYKQKTQAKSNHR